jgi:hypothetical protein
MKTRQRRFVDKGCAICASRLPTRMHCERADIQRRRIMAELSSQRVQAATIAALDDDRNPIRRPEHEALGADGFSHSGTIDRHPSRQVEELLAVLQAGRCYAQPVATGSEASDAHALAVLHFGVVHDIELVAQLDSRSFELQFGAIGTHEARQQGHGGVRGCRNALSFG